MNVSARQSATEAIHLHNNFPSRRGGKEKAKGGLANNQDTNLLTINKRLRALQIIKQPIQSYKRTL